MFLISPPVSIISLIARPAKLTLDIACFVAPIGSDVPYEQQKDDIALVKNERKPCWHRGGYLIRGVMIDPFNLWCLMWLVEVCLFKLALRPSNWNFSKFKHPNGLQHLTFQGLKLARAKREPQIVSVALPEVHHACCFFILSSVF